MALTLENKFSHTSSQNGSSGTLTGITISAENDTFIVVCIATDNTSFNTVSSLYLSSPEVTEAFLLTRYTQSTGAEVWYKAAPAYTPGIHTATITANLSGTYNFGIAAYVFNGAKQSTPFETFGLDAQVTGEPNSPGTVSVTSGHYMMDAVRIAENTISADGSQTEEMNIASGSGATLYTYGSSYEAVPTDASYLPGWTRTGSPADKAWGYCFVVLQDSTTTYARIINS